jgi:integrase
VAGGKTASIEKTGNKRGKAIVKGGKGTAARTTGLLGGIFSFAVSEGVISTNPARGAKRPADNHRVRRLSAEEYRLLGMALAEAEANAEAMQGIVGIWLLALTGCRSGEIINLEWDEVDEEGSCLRLTESKEGASVRPAGLAAFEMLTKAEKKKSCPYVLMPIRGSGAFGGMPRAWKRAIKSALLPGVTPHTLRHSYASVAGDLGFTESTIAALLGHAAGSVTSRYVHHLDSVLVAGANKVAATIYGMMTADRLRSESSISYPLSLKCD